MRYQRQIIGYHGCLKDTFEAALVNGTHPTPSSSHTDWLGTGVYFWEYGPNRALEWAKQKAIRAGRSTDDARVLGAVIQLGSCFDLLDTEATDLLSLAFADLTSTLAPGTELPKNTTPARLIAESGHPDVLLRARDRAVIELAIDTEAAADPPTFYQTVRGAFWEGGAAFPGAAIEKRSHIQVSVRDMTCIIGYFKPVPV